MGEQRQSLFRTPKRASGWDVEGGRWYLNLLYSANYHHFPFTEYVDIQINILPRMELPSGPYFLYFIYGSPRPRFLMPTLDFGEGEN